MKRKIKIIIIVLISFIIVGCKSNKESSNYKIVATNFPCYDFARAVVKDSDFSTEMLLKPGAEIHDFEPTPQDIIKIKNSDIFIYVGGDSDEWVKKVLTNIDTKKTKIIRLMDLVKNYEEEIVEGMEEEEEHHHNHEEEHDEEVEYDEHVWTSPVNAITIVDKIKDEVLKIDIKNKEKYISNAEKYITELNLINDEFKSLVSKSKRKEIIFGDRFPLRYFALEYGLTYFAAFPGCSEATETSAKTIKFLINKIKEDSIPVIFKIELSNGKIASTIAKETGVKVLEFNSAHNISKDKFNAGITYVNIMKDNIKVLKEALN